MKSLTEHLWFEVPDRRGFVNITPKIEELVRKAACRKGFVWSTPCTSPRRCSSTTTRAGLHHDYDVWLEKLAPHAPTSALPSQSHRRRQRRRPPETPDHGPRSRRGHHQGQTRFRPVGANLLRRVRRPPPKAGAGEDHRGVNRVEINQSSVYSLGADHPSARVDADVAPSIRRFPESLGRRHRGGIRRTSAM